MKKTFIIQSIFIALFLFITTGFCDENEDSSDERTFFALPVAMYSTDTGFGAGAAAIKSYNSSTRQASTLQLLSYYTTKKQFLSAIKWEHYFRNNNRIILQLRYQKFPTNFYGLGNNTSNDHPEKYTPEFVEGEISYEKFIISHLKILTKFSFRNQSLIRAEPDGLLKSKSVPWNYGRFDAGPGIGLLWDSRDNTYATKRGTLVKLEYRGIMLQSEGGAFNSFSLDMRKFINPFSECVLAYQIQFEDYSGNIPFYYFADIGGENRLRGYEYFRFLGKKSILFQHDIRFPIWWRIGGVVFIASGRVADKIGDLTSGKYHTGYGTGLRFIFNKKDNLVLRFDIARGKDSSGVYATFSEAF